MTTVHPLSVVSAPQTWNYLTWLCLALTLGVFKLLMRLFPIRWDGTPGGKNYRQVSVHRLRRQQAADGEEEAARRVEEGRPVLQHRRPASVRSRKVCVLSGPSRWHFQASRDSLCVHPPDFPFNLKSINQSHIGSCIDADGKERTWPRRRWQTSSQWLPASWRQMSTGLKWKVKHAYLNM